MVDSIRTPAFIFDLPTCTNYFSWFYDEDREKVPEKINLFDLHASSAIQACIGNPALIQLPNCIADILSQTYTDRPLELSSFLEATKIESFPAKYSQNEAIIKLAILNTLRKQPVYLVISDKYVYGMLAQILKKVEIKELSVINLTELGKFLSDHSQTQRKK